MAASAYPPPDAPGTIYLLHFSGRTKRGQQHYLGWTSNIERRITQLRLGSGAGVTRNAVAEGLKLTVARTWKGTPDLETRLKEWSRQGRKGFSGICPFCAGDAPLPPDVARDLGAPTLRIRYLDSA